MHKHARLFFRLSSALRCYACIVLPDWSPGLTHICKTNLNNFNSVTYLQQCQCEINRLSHICKVLWLYSQHFIFFVSYEWTH